MKQWDKFIAACVYMCLLVWCRFIIFGWPSWKEVCVSESA